MSAPAVTLKLTLSLAVVVALGPAAIDMYLASMPQMSTDLKVSYAATQWTLTIFLMAMGLGQLIFGPLSDAYGRRKPLILGVVTYIIAAWMASISTSLEWLITARLFQGLGAATAIVVVMSMVRDVAEEQQAAQLYALLNSIVALGPIIAPAIGGLLGAHYGWQGIMLFLAGLGTLVLINSLFNIPETLQTHQRERLELKSIFLVYVNILKQRFFLLQLLALSAVFFFLFAYIGGSSFIYQNNYGLSVEQFGLVFGLTSISLIVGASLSAYLVKKIPLSKLAYLGAFCMSIAGFVCLIAEFFNFGLVGIVSGIACALLGLGILEATIMALAMNSQSQNLGASAALLGAIPMVLASIATPIAGVLVEIHALYWVGLLALIGPLILVLVHRALKRQVACV
ncbi:multidrug effflux MFS transporter [uncultured Acinetobacter sp.]|uniref:multidrug effflux MFS transporter n=1 Tax=uncultured Acinetobacter sp. TaxID=165433 RepID=UPI00261AB6F5|nr:multidrug effflux MFS transporter [uncultured Acinetobacter sp.]